MNLDGRDRHIIGMIWENAKQEEDRLWLGEVYVMENWQAFAFFKGNQDSKDYQDVLSNHLLPKIYPEENFMQHNALFTLLYQQRPGKKIAKVYWRPDLNPIEKNHNWGRQEI